MVSSGRLTAAMHLPSRRLPKRRLLRGDRLACTCALRGLLLTPRHRHPCGPRLRRLLGRRAVNPVSHSFVRWIAGSGVGTTWGGSVLTAGGVIASAARAAAGAVAGATPPPAAHPSASGIYHGCCRGGLSFWRFAPHQLSCDSFQHGHLSETHSKQLTVSLRLHADKHPHRASWVWRAVHRLAGHSGHHVQVSRPACLNWVTLTYCD